MELENRGDGAHLTAREAQDRVDGWPESGRPRTYPELLTHPYAPHALNEAIVLYCGPYCLPPSDPDEHAYVGVIELTWLPVESARFSTHPR